jgi:hypothetical protein
LDFDQPVITGAAPLKLRDTARRPYRVGLPTLSMGGRRLAAAVPERLGEGGYRVHWQVSADDGDLASGTITFTVGSGAAPAAGGADAGGSVDSPLVIGLRWLLFSGLSLASGGVFGARLVRPIAGEAAALELDPHRSAKTDEAPRNVRPSSNPCSKSRTSSASNFLAGSVAWAGQEGC